MKLKHFFVKNITVVSIVVAAAAVGGAVWYIRSNAAPAFGTAVAAQGNVVEAVDESGSVMSEHNTALSFQEGGEISSVSVQNGSVVAQGAPLAGLDASQVSAAVLQANAALAAAQAKLDGLKNGTRPEALQIDQTAVASAKNAVLIAVQNSYSSAVDAVENQTDNLFSNPKSSNPTFVLATVDVQSANNLSAQRVAIGASLSAWYSELATSSDSAALSSFADQTLSSIQSYLNSLTLALNGPGASGAISQTTLAGYKAYVTAARTELQAAVSVLSGAESSYSAAESQLTLAQAGATSQDIEAQQAVVAQAQAAAASAQVALDHASLIAPFSGTVQNLTAQVGQVVSPGQPVLTLVNQSGLKIEAYVSQADVAKIKEGDAAQITLDALGPNVSLPATVTTIDTAETQSNGAPSYLVTLHFTNPDPRIRDGMTANVHIITAEHDNVTEIPSNLVISDNGQDFVLMEKNGQTVRQPVQVGIEGGGTTEIISGLNVGDRVSSF